MDFVDIYKKKSWNMANSVMLEEVSKGLYILGQNSSLISNITFGYSIHSLMVESEIYENNEWYDFAFGINLKNFIHD